MIAEGNIWNNRTNMFERTLFFFDTGAQTSHVEEQFAKQLRLPITKSETSTMTEIGGHTEEFLTHRLSVCIKTAFGTELLLTMKTKSVITKDFRAATLSGCDIQFLSQEESFLSNLSTQGERQVPSILIGLDLDDKFVITNSPHIRFMIAEI
uniref:Peptidase A2 domain-containing protein n=1 Tax=Heterorhabditis bacteriophora TaxID=37862 RepID=A0A1I7WUL6_HETBA